MIPDYRIKIYRRQDSSCNLLFDSLSHMRKEDIISIKAEQTVSGEVGEAVIEIDNDPPIRVGSPPDRFKVDDIVEIWLGWQGSSLAKVFSGIIYKVEESSRDEDKVLILSAKDWSSLFLTGKFSGSYPEGENAGRIVKDIISEYLKTADPVTTYGLIDDGYIFNNGTSYSEVRDAASGTLDYTSTSMQIGQKATQDSYSGHKYVSGQNIELNEGWEFNGSGNYLQYSGDNNYIKRRMEVEKKDPYELLVYTFVNEHKGWNHVGSNPLSSDDADTSYIYLANSTSNLGKYDQYYRFPQLGYAFISLHGVYIKWKAKSTGYPNSYGGITIYYSVDNGQTWKTDGSSRTVWQSGYNWYSTENLVTDINNKEKVNNLRVKIEFSGVTGSTGETRITAMKLVLIGYFYFGAFDTIRYWTFQQITSSLLQGGTVTKAELYIVGKNEKAAANIDAADVMVAFSLWDGNQWSPYRYLTWTASETSWVTKKIDFTFFINTVEKFNSCRLAVMSQLAMLLPNSTHGVSFACIDQAYFYVEVLGPAWHYIWRGYLFFDTSQIPKEVEIESAFLELYTVSKRNDSSTFDLVIQTGSSEYPHRPLQSIDYNRTYYSGNGGSLNESGFAVNSYSLLPLNETGISWIQRGPGAITKFVIRSSKDINGQPSGANKGEWVIIATGNSSNPPKLTITYYTSPGICEKKITCSIEATQSTRQLDFEGESIIDSLNKVSMLTKHDWYVDENKTFRWFKRDVEGGTSVKTLTSTDLVTYSVSDPYENVCNKVHVYGAAEKTLPWDQDWAESINNWTGLSSCSISATDEIRPKAGRKVIKISLPPRQTWYSNYYDYTYTYCLNLYMPHIFEVYTIISPPEGWGIRFHRAGCRHEGVGSVTINWKMGEDGAYIPLGSSFSNDFKWRCIEGNYCPDTSNCYIDLPINVPLYVKFSLDMGLNFFQCGKMKEFKIEFRYWKEGEYDTEEFSVRFTLPSKVDLTPKGGFRKLKFVANSQISATLVGQPDLKIKLIFEEGHSAIYSAQYFGIKPNEWKTFEIPIGPGAEEEGWEGEPSGTLNSIEISYIVPVMLYNQNDKFYIDWFHLGEGRYFGSYEDLTSQNKYGVRFKEIFDDTIFSDVAAQRRAKEYIEKFKEPISTVDNVEAEFEGQENLDPGQIVTLDLDELLSPTKYRIERITHKFTEDFEYTTELLLSLDPVTWEGKIHDISERVRRLEQKMRRKRSEEPTEID